MRRPFATGGMKAMKADSCGGILGQPASQPPILKRCIAAAVRMCPTQHLTRASCQIRWNAWRQAMFAMGGISAGECLSLVRPLDPVPSQVGRADLGADPGEACCRY